MTAAETMKGYWIATVLQAERKAAQGAAPVYVYLLAWETPVGGGRLRAHHALDVPLVFDNVESTRNLVGPGSEPQRMADLMSSAWIAFARAGNPNNKALPHWPAYDVNNRATMIFNLDSRLIDVLYEVDGIRMPLLYDWPLDRNFVSRVPLDRNTRRGLYRYIAIRDAHAGSPTGWIRVDAAVRVK
jgi:hypothetical protein